MKAMVGLMGVFVLAGCGMTVTSAQVVSGREVSRTKTVVSFDSVETTIETNDPLMERCLAQVGTFPDVQDGERTFTVRELCAREVLRELERQDRQKRLYADPYYLYGR
jgi:uncharacterized lipoprotein YajG